MRTAVLGMGNMGRAVAERLLGAGHEVTVWNRTAGRAGSLLAAGAREASDAAQAAAQAQATFTSLADDAAVREVVAGVGGVGAALGDGVLIDVSTVSPQSTALISEAAGGRLLAAPILGAPAAVTAGEAAYLICGPHELVELVAPVLESLAPQERRIYLGEDLALAPTLKLLSNYLLMSGIAALAEVVATAQAAGLADELILGFLGRAPLVAPALHNRLQDIVSGEHDGWFTTTLGAKDVRLAEQLASSHGLELPLAAAVAGRYEEAARQGWAQADLGAIVELLRGR